MEKTIKIGSKYINFKATCGTLCIYKQQFGTEYSEDRHKLTTMENSGLYTSDEIYLEQYTISYRLIWSMAKNADKTIPDPKHWAEQFKKFSVTEILSQIMELFPNDEKTKNKDVGDGESISSEELTACAIACELTTEDIYNMPIDFLVKTISESVNIKTGKTKKRVRNATQQDIDRFF